LKKRVLVALLVVSCLLNAAGITFFILFLSAESHVKSLSRNLKKQATNIEIVRAEPNQANSSAILSKRMFISQYDGFPDTFAVAPPFLLQPTKAVTLVVYLHGQSSTFLEPFETGEGKCLAETVIGNSNTVLLSCNYRAPASWGNDAAISDITQNIREMCQEYPVTKMVIMGTSMGGSVAPTYAAIAPPDIKEKLVGVVSVEGSGNLGALYNQTKMTAVKNAMIISFGGPPEIRPEVYMAKSFLTHVNELPKSVKFAVVSASKDTVVPPSLQKEMVESLEKAGIQVKAIEVGIHHEAPPISTYREALHFVLN
jgi:Prolyl oligopeptidase family